MFKRFTPSARQVVLGALEHARSLGHSEMGPEHLLLGALRSGGVSEAALAQLGLREESARARIGAMLPPQIGAGQGGGDDDAGGDGCDGHGADGHGAKEISLSAEGVWTIAAAVRVADDSDADPVGSGHVLLALARTEAARSVLRDCSIAPDEVGRVVIEQQLRLASVSVGRVADPAAGTAAGTVAEPIDDFATPLADARALLAIRHRGGSVAACLGDHGIDEAAVLEEFAALGRTA